MKYTPNTPLITKGILALFFSSFFLLSCTREGRLSNLSNIYVTDNMGNRIGGDPSDGQWQNRRFTERELDLFADLDSASLDGSLKPSSINVRYALPNPFINYVTVPFTVAQDYEGEMVLKYVIVNSSMNTVQKGTFRLQANSHSSFAINPTFSKGSYRLYFTFSAQGEEHFYKSWGNIERK